MKRPPRPSGVRTIESILPHREPFLLLDEVIELEPGERVVARRSASREDDWWFAGPLSRSGRSCPAC